MAQAKVHLVSGHCGSHADACDWLVRGFTDVRAARAFCKQLNALCKQYGCHQSHLFEPDGSPAYGIHGDKKRLKKLIPELAKLDPEFNNDYNGTWYNVTSVPLD